MASERIKGISIKLSADTTAIDNALKDVNKELSSTQKELTQVDKLLKFDPKNTTLLAQKQKLLSDAINQTKSKLSELQKVKELADKDDSVDKNTKEYRELERQIEQTQQKLKGFQDQTKDLGKQFNETSKQSLDFADVLKANLLSDAIVGGIKLIGNAIKEVGKEMASIITETASYADDVNTLAKQYNLSTKEIQQYQKASALIDVEFNTIAKSLQKLTKNMTSTSKETTNAFKELGIKVKDTNGQLRDSNDVFNETIEALSNIENETLQDSLALQIFGKSSAELGSLINGGAEQLKEFNQYLEENNLLLSQDELDSLNEVQDGFDYLDVTIDTLKKKIGAELAPVVKPLLDEINTFLLEHKEDIVNLVKEVVDTITSEDFKQWFSNIVDKIKTFVDEQLPKIIEDIPKIVEDLKTMGEVLGGIAKIVITIVDALKWAFEHNAEDKGKMFPSLFGDWNVNHGGSGGNFSGGFGSLQSGGYSNQITLNASFIANGNLDEAQALRFADLISERVNENLGNMI